MITIHATQKLIKKIPLDDNGRLTPEESSVTRPEQAVDINPLRHWHANLLTIQRRLCVILIHDLTRFPVFIPCLAKKEFSTFQTEFDYAFMNTILKCGVDDNQMETAHRLLEPLSFDSNCDRSVQGSMNQMAQYAKHMIDYRDLDVTQITGHRLGAHLADTPCTVKGRKETVWPMRDMLALLK